MTQLERACRGDGAGEHLPERAVSTPAHRARWQAPIELVLIVAALALLAVLGARVFSAIAALGAWWLLPAACGVGVVAADFGSGVLHWLCDRFFREDTPVLGPMLIQPFREHHRDPKGITRHGLLELHGNSCLPIVAVLAAALWLAPGAPHGRATAGLGAALFFFLAAALATNQLHLWAHLDAPPRTVRWLQQARLVLTHGAHARHHSGDYRQSYCITTGWLNGPLDRIAFFPRLEARIRRILGDGPEGAPASHHHASPASSPRDAASRSARKS